MHYFCLPPQTHYIILLLMDTCIVSSFWLLIIKLLWIFLNMTWWAGVLLFLCYISRSRIIGSQDWFLILVDNARIFQNDCTNLYFLLFPHLYRHVVFFVFCYSSHSNLLRQLITVLDDCLFPVSWSLYLCSPSFISLPPTL